MWLLHGWHDSGRGPSRILLPPQASDGLHLSVELNALNRENGERHSFIMGFIKVGERGGERERERERGGGGERERERE